MMRELLIATLGTFAAVAVANPIIGGGTDLEHQSPRRNLEDR